MSGWVISFSPLVPLSALLTLLLLAGVFFALGLLRRRVYFIRCAFFVLLSALLSDPSLVKEARKALPGQALIVIDGSASMDLESRHDEASEALAYTEKKIKDAGIEPIVLHASSETNTTKIFKPLMQAAESVPASQGAGVVLITDGEVHDVPEDIEAKLGPLNVILTGSPHAYDRRVLVMEAPKYGLLRQEITIKVQAEEEGQKPSSAAPLVLRVQQDNEAEKEYSVESGKTQPFTFTLTHPGQNVFRFRLAPVAEELTPANNAAAIVVNAVRDRLRVLLVTGQPYEGGRPWRDLLKSDPAVDLVHFTILRSPLSFDGTPAREMALIPFPVDELFEKKIKDFDLIIFDKYGQAEHELLQDRYFANIARFVQDGGAFMAALGPPTQSHAQMPGQQENQGLFDTPLAEVLPVTVLAKPLPQGAYRPALTEDGMAHPVTQDLTIGKQIFGQWFSQLPVSAKPESEVLLKGIQDTPLLVLGTAGSGRVAALMSEDAWMWAKDIHGGGPYAPLLRNVAHWLMKEPELEEGYIKAELASDGIIVSARKQKDNNTITMTNPLGQQQVIEVEEGKDGWLNAHISAKTSGLYAFTNGKHSAFVALGAGEGEEFRRMLATEEKLAPLIQKTGGTRVWWEKDKTPSFHLRDTHAYDVTGRETLPLLPAGLSLFILLGGLALVWWREGRRS